MSWEDCAIVYYDDIANSPNVLQVFKDRSIPISPDYLVEMERCGDKFIYKWKRKDAQQAPKDGAD